MITSPLLSNVRLRAMITPVSPLLTRLIHISLIYWTIYCSFEIILKMRTVHWIGLQINCFKKHSVRYEFYCNGTRITNLLICIWRPKECI